MTSVRLISVALAAMLALAAGCGDETSPGEAVPALSQRLERVDQAIETGDFANAREQLDRLVAETARADVAGEISNEQADRILEAVEAVLAGLPAAEQGDGSPPAEPAPEPEPADGENPDEEQDEEPEENDEKGNKDKKDKDEEKGGD